MSMFHWKKKTDAANEQPSETQSPKNKREEEKLNPEKLSPGKLKSGKQPEMEENGESIINGILQEAREEAEKQVSQAKKSAAQREKTWKSQARRLRNEAQQEAEEKAEDIRRSGRSRQKIEEKKRRLQLQEQLVSAVLDKALNDIEGMIDADGYAEVLENLITEAALGIQTDEAVVSASAKEKPLISDSILRSAEKRTKKISGRSIKLSLSSDQPLPGQGLVLSSPDGSVAFSNQIRVRLLRNQSEIRHMIYKDLLSDTGDSKRNTDNGDAEDTDAAESGKAGINKAGKSLKDEESGKKGEETE